mmetsp:Transcript_173313/g.555894  ORF Transcript_173313/g.555894 Transcript_173313/m.555894 type:complete len:204 (-) Transcript_173313:1104-1715(-)
MAARPPRPHLRPRRPRQQGPWPPGPAPRLWWRRHKTRQRSPALQIFLRPRTRCSPTTCLLLFRTFSLEASWRKAKAKAKMILLEVLMQLRVQLVPQPLRRPMLRRQMLRRQLQSLRAHRRRLRCGGMRRPSRCLKPLRLPPVSRSPSSCRKCLVCPSSGPVLHRWTRTLPMRRTSSKFCSGVPCLWKSQRRVYRSSRACCWAH